jgi:hypothetical protein
MFTWNGILLWLVTTAMTGRAKEATFKGGRGMSERRREKRRDWETRRD